MEGTDAIEVIASKKEMHVIQILGNDNTTGNLKMSDKGRSKVDTCDWILWLLHPDLGVKDILEIKAKSKPGNLDVFQSGPSRIGKSSNWRGQIKCDIEQFTKEEYDIVWVDSQGDSHTYDPRILVNPDV